MRTETHTIKVSGPTLTLDDLRWLVQQCAGLSPDSTVDVRNYSDPRESDMAISVNGKPALNKLHGNGTCRTPRGVIPPEMPPNMEYR